MTYMNGLNQEYLVQFGERSFLDSIAACLRLCVNNMRHRDLKTDSPTMKVLVACLLAIWRVLLNISHDNGELASYSWIGSSQFFFNSTTPLHNSIPPSLGSLSLPPRREMQRPTGRTSPPGCSLLALRP